MKEFLEHLALPTDPQTILLLVFVIALVITSLQLILHEKYDDGVIGKGSLWAIVFACSVVIGSIFTNVEYDVSNDILLLIAAFASFHWWHLWRFRRRCRAMVRTQEHNRRKSDRRWVSDEVKP